MFSFLLLTVFAFAEPETSDGGFILPYGFWHRNKAYDPSDPIAMSSTQILYPPPTPLGRVKIHYIFWRGHWWAEQNGSWIVYHHGWLAYREGMFGGPPR